MNTDHLARIVNEAAHRAYIGVEYADALIAAQDDLTAMRTPITAEALIADGWSLLYVSKLGVSRYKFGRAEIAFWDDGDKVFYFGNVGGAIRVPQNMHDLHELVRILGASA